MNRTGSNQIKIRLLSLVCLMVILAGCVGSIINAQASSQTKLYGYTIDRLSTRSGPGTGYKDMGTYPELKNKWVEVRSRAWDKTNEIWWVEVLVGDRWLWTGYKRFDSTSLPLENIPVYGSEDYTEEPVIVYGYALYGLVTRNGPGMNYDWTGLFAEYENEWVAVRSRAWNADEEIWWVEVQIGEDWLWTMYHYLDSETLPVESIPLYGEDSSYGALYGYTIERLSTRSGPGTKYTDMGSYNQLKNQWVEVRSRAWDKTNEIWWVEVLVGDKWLWTGYKRFDNTSLPLENIPINPNY